MVSARNVPGSPEPLDCLIGAWIRGIRNGTVYPADMMRIPSISSAARRIACAGVALLLLCTTPFGCLGAEGNASRHVEVTLLSEVRALQPGTSVWLGVHQKIEPGWHTYWRNPGDSGQEPTIKWQLPDGFRAGEIVWPYPERVPYGPLMNFAYHDEVMLPVRVDLPGTLSGGEVTLAGVLEYLVCADICIPEDAPFSLTLPVVPTGTDPLLDVTSASTFAQTRRRLPVPLPVPVIVREVETGVSLSADLAGVDTTSISAVEFFPYAEGIIEYPSDQTLSVAGSTLSVGLTTGYNYTDTSSFDGILVVTIGAGDSAVTSAYEFEAVRGEGPGAGLDMPNGQTGVGLLLSLLFAFAGGVVLNLMPCVFPVLSIKILSLMEHANDGRIRLHGFVYAAGVILGFLAIAGVLLALRAGGAQIGWGFQLQSPVVVTLIAYLLFLVGLNLSGMFEVGYGIMGLGAGRGTGSGFGGSFMTGVLAVIVAAPCTAPFMAAATGFALTADPVAALAVFAMLGLGMAVPYVLLCHAPWLLDRLPRPGAWMDTLRQFLAFPMYATAVWLVWILVQQMGTDGVITAGGGMVLLAFAVWMLRHLGSRRWGRALGQFAAADAIVLALVVPFWMQGDGATAATMEQGHPRSGAGPTWTAWTPSKLDVMRREQPVFVNFTAAWCITCKVNEVVAIDTKATGEAFVQLGIGYLKGDWTREDPQITQELARFGRSGVPLYVFYPEQGVTPVVLPQILTEGELLRVIEGKGRKEGKAKASVDDGFGAG